MQVCIYMFFFLLSFAREGAESWLSMEYSTSLENANVCTEKSRDMQDKRNK